MNTEDIFSSITPEQTETPSNHEAHQGLYLDNRTSKSRVIQFLQDHARNKDAATFDIVTGYFSIDALAMLNAHFNPIIDGKHVKQFRLLLGRLAGANEKEHFKIDLLAGADGTMLAALSLSKTAKRAVAFLEMHNVQVKTQTKRFCHAKAYIYTNKHEIGKCFSVIGSSNLTFAGLGVNANSGNIELNVPDIPSRTNRHAFDELNVWFEKLWNDSKVSADILIDGKKRVFRDFIIDMIKRFYKEYSPLELYDKILFEMFKKDLFDYAQNKKFQVQLSHLHQTAIWKVLYSFQRQGALSAIRMLDRFGGAIIGDAVGLGKTWEALAVIKFFALQGYAILLLAPKRLEQNWNQFLYGGNSKFESDEFRYIVRYHTDLQGERLSSYPINKLEWLQKQPKLLVVIDESHNLRNDKSGRYTFLVENILKKVQEVKVLHLSATPINTKLTDIRNQFKLLVRGQNDGFQRVPSLEFVHDLEIFFREAQKKYTQWTKEAVPKVQDLVTKLGDQFFELTDQLIVARTRAMIQQTAGDLHFPEKRPPINKFTPPGNIGSLVDLNDILSVLEQIFFAAYRPAEYMEGAIDTGDAKTKALRDDKNRQRFLAKMMYFLIIKRLESSWKSVLITLKNVAARHEKVLKEVTEYQVHKKQASIAITSDADETDDGDDDIPEDIAELLEVSGSKTIGKQAVAISELKDLDGFKSRLLKDVQSLNLLVSELTKKEMIVSSETGLQSSDTKLAELLKILDDKRKKTNPKVVVFTTYTSTAEYLYNELVKRGFERVAMVSGESSRRSSSSHETTRKFDDILCSFAPYSKLYKEKDWSTLYAKAGVSEANFMQWRELIVQYDKVAAKKLSDPIDILIATDCLSEGQNLQDADLVINYDIHWNPVRLIQRMGRIDRLGSPNTIIAGINFWPAKDYNAYLNFKKRVESRMAIMTFVGTEVEEELTQAFKAMMDGNPIAEKLKKKYQPKLEEFEKFRKEHSLESEQAKRMFEAMELEWKNDGETEGQAGLNNLSFEEFRAELFDTLQHRAKDLENIPNCVYSGFALNHREPQERAPGIVALLGYPKRSDPTGHYDETYLVFRSLEGNKILETKVEILSFLRAYKKAARMIPPEIEQLDEGTIRQFAASLTSWFDEQAPEAALQDIDALFSPVHKHRKIDLHNVDDKFNPENFDLVTWLVTNGAIR